jgi:hypothetical protein
MLNGNDISGTLRMMQMNKIIPECQPQSAAAAPESTVARLGFLFTFAPLLLKYENRIPKDHRQYNLLHG